MPFDGSASIARALRSDCVGLSEVSPLVVIVSQVAQQTGVLGIGLQCLVVLGERAGTVALSVVQHRQVVRDGFQARIVAAGLLVEQNGLLRVSALLQFLGGRPNMPCGFFWEAVRPAAVSEAVDSLSEDVVSESVFDGEESRAGATQSRRSSQRRPSHRNRHLPVTFMVAVYLVQSGHNQSRRSLAG